MYSRRWGKGIAFLVLLFTLTIIVGCGGEPEVETVIEQVEVTRIVEGEEVTVVETRVVEVCLLYTSPSPRD